MPSLRNILFVAVTAFAALSFAAPVSDHHDGANVAQHDSVLPFAIAGIKIADGNKIGDFNSGESGLGKAPGRGGPHGGEGHQGDKVGDLVDLGLVRRDSERSLCDSIVLAGAKIRVIWDQMSKVTSQNNIDDNAVVELIARVKVVLDATFVDLQRQRGRPMEEILAINGRVATKAELAHLLIDLANLVCGLLSIAAYVSAKATVDVIVSVGVVFAEVFCATFTVVDGLYVVVRPGLDSALKIAVSLKLDALVSAYNGVY
ncbi:hypothetical protein H0H81_000934 [Sphagnurus paluster]|uniref:Uncharacterized protein n=1 Tax=Sphagnurus paluster TaxID=117069 RepID=A0A9P7FQ06_9AGAR|nr:hypothetical protein H0H81_000934 [Sphagnurus paluster]